MSPTGIKIGLEQRQFNKLRSSFENNRGEYTPVNAHIQLKSKMDSNPVMQQIQLKAGTKQ
jgi:hypothetical protein